MVEIHVVAQTARWLRSLVSVAVICLLLIASAQSGTPSVKPLAQRKLKIHYQPIVASFSVGEPVFVKQSIINYGDEVEYYEPLDVSSYAVYNSDGDQLVPHSSELEVEYVRSTFVPGKGDGICRPLGPGDTSKAVVIDVSERFGIKKVGAGSYVPVGDYRMFSRNMSSDTICFRVAMPIDSAGLEAAKLFLALFAGTARQVDLQLLIDNYARIVREYPRSRLTPRCLYYLIAVGDNAPTPLHPDSIQSYAIQLIERFPELEYYSMIAAITIDPHSVNPYLRSRAKNALEKLLSASSYIIGEVRDSVTAKVKALSW